MVAILTRVLTLVTCVPLLLPPGLCVCKAGGASCTPPHRESVAARDDGPTASHTSGRCSHRHHCHAPDGVDDPVAAPPGQPQPDPQGDHAPGCPAATAGVERVQWSEPAVDPAQAAVPAAFVGFLLAPMKTECHPSGRPVVNWPSSPPLYLSHCSLVI